MSDGFKFVMLLVDDEEGILKSLRRLLKTLEAEIVTAPNAEEALKIVEKAGISLVISDQRMPGMSGVELLQQVRKISPDTVRILLTGYADIDATIKAINDGAVKYYLNKPWDDDMLLSRVRESLDLYKVTIENRRLTQLVLQRNQELKKLNDNLEGKVSEHTRRIFEQHQELKQSFMETIKSFSSLLELRHKDLGNHCQRVATVAKDLIGDMGLSEKEAQDIFVAALLHDIGKIALSDDILRKDRDSLNKTELGNFARHPIMGQSFVYQINGFEEIGIIIRHHHEDYGGGGFPDGLVEKRIPLGSRIIRVADTFDHLAYRLGYPSVQTVNEAMAHLVQYMGMKYDPDVVRRFVEQDFARRYIRKGESEIVAVIPRVLQEDMVIAADVYTKNGMFLLPKGARLSAGMIRRLVKIDGIDPIEKGVEVYRKEEPKGVAHAAV